jgi:hypothetical protein
MSLTKWHAVMLRETQPDKFLCRRVGNYRAVGQYGFSERKPAEPSSAPHIGSLSL